MKRNQRLAALAAAVVATAGLSTACMGATMRDAEMPACSGDRVDALILVAQAVPTAESIPCLAGYPAGWTFGSVEVRDGHARFTLDSDRGGSDALEVTLAARCDVTNATEVPSDEPGTVRYDRISRAESDLQTVRSYRFPGGCVNYRFDMDRPTPALVDEASAAVSFLTRYEVNARADAQEKRNG